ncbi:MAG: hypothetical protein OXC44_03935 [Proteobacteria bacterium]|nr:hypothetical protein [Pseudomonadota bacterium]
MNRNVHITPPHTLAGLTLLEVILVIALLAGMMSYTVSGLLPSKDYTSTFLALQAQIKSTFDSAVLTAVPHRMVFDTKASKIMIQRLEHKEGTTPTTITFTTKNHESLEEEKLALENKKENLEVYKDLGGDDVTDIDTQTTIKASTPVLQAMEQLMGQRWIRAGDFAEGDLSFSGLRITRYFTEHLETEIITDRGESAHKEFFLYFYPHGYVEKAYIIFHEVDDQGTPLEDVSPYVLRTLPFEGISMLSANIADIDTILSNTPFKTPPP